MKTNKPSPVKENTEPKIIRKTVILGVEEKLQKFAKAKIPFGFIAIIAIVIGIGSLVYKKTDWELVKAVPTIQDKPHFFKTIKSKQYFKSVVVPTPVPVIPAATEEKPTIEIKSGKKQKISYEHIPGYYAYDSLIVRESKKYPRVKPVVIKAIIEQESTYNPIRQKYEAKWERDYGYMIPKKRHENMEEWQMNFRSYGLMQISYVLHKDFCELRSYVELLNPETNIACGTKIFAACIAEGNSDSYCIKKHNGSGPLTEIYKNEVLGRVARLMSVPTKLMS